MPGSATVIRQERLKKTHARTIPLALFTITEEEELQKTGNARRPKGTPQPHSLTGAGSSTGLYYLANGFQTALTVPASRGARDPTHLLVTLAYPQGMEYAGVEIICVSLLYFRSATF